MQQHRRAQLCFLLFIAIAATAIYCAHMISFGCCRPASLPEQAPDHHYEVEHESDPQTPFSVYDGINKRAVSIINTRCNKTLETFMASPSLIKLGANRLLAVVEQEVHTFASKAPKAVMEAIRQRKLVFASDDGGETWSQVGSIAPMHWPQVFTTSSGTYVIGTERYHSKDSNIVISKMISGSNGTKWTLPVKLTKGLSVISGNTGVDISGGKVTKTFEVTPSMNGKLPRTLLTAAATLNVPDKAAAWEHPPVLHVTVQNTKDFVQYTLVKIAVKGLWKSIFFRVVGIQPASSTVSLRVERFCLEWLPKRVDIPEGAVLKIGPGVQQYVALDWVAMAMSADEAADLTDPKAWTLSNGVGNPAAVHAEAMRLLFDIGQDPRGKARKFSLGFDVPTLAAADKAKEDTVAAAWDAGFGPLYWMEGVATRLVDRHGGSGKVLSIMRVNNDLHCDLAALVEFDDSNGIQGRFLRFARIPGASIAHPAVLYDEESDLYWMVSNLNRDAVRSWNTTNPRIRWNAFTMCETDRSTLVLYYSSNMINWVHATVIDYHMRLDRHYTYPHAVIDGKNLLVVSRATFVGRNVAMNETEELDACFNNHNSNSIAFHRVPHFRRYANVEWATFMGMYTKMGPRRTALKDEYPGQKE